MSDHEKTGGEGGGESIPEGSNDLSTQPEKLVLKRSELAILRRMADKYPITPGERQEMLDVVMDTARKAKSFRTKLGAAKMLTAMDKINHDELRLYIAAQRDEELTPEAVVINNNVNNVVIKVPEEEFLARAAKYADAFGSVAGGGNGQPVDTPHANGTANGVHAEPGA